MISGNLKQVLAEIRQVCEHIGRNVEDISLIGVSKYARLEDVQEAIDLGLKDIGENKVQEAKLKFSQLKGTFKRHMIGHLQSNKVKVALEIFDLIHSVDSLKLVRSIENCASQLNHQTDILLQVNTSKEKSKFGLDPADVPSLIESIQDFHHIKVKGLMTMAPFTEEEKVIRHCFSSLRKQFNLIKKNFQGHGAIDMQFLSMGMSGDYNIALEEGSNMVRIGSAIFKH